MSGDNVVAVTTLRMKKRLATIITTVKTTNQKTQKAVGNKEYIVWYGQLESDYEVSATWAFLYI